jgi:hypothetical protein
MHTIDGIPCNRSLQLRRDGPAAERRVDARQIEDVVLRPLPAQPFEDHLGACLAAEVRLLPDVRDAAQDDGRRARGRPVVDREVWDGGPLDVDGRRRGRLRRGGLGVLRAGGEGEGQKE